MCAVEDALTRAGELGLLETRADGSVVLHRLLAAFVRQEGAGELEAAQDAAEQAVFEVASRLNQAGYPGPLTAWRVHLRIVAQTAADRNSATASNLLNELGYHLRTVADLLGAARP